MSVSNPVVEKFDIADRTIWIKGSVSSFHPIDDVMEEYVHARKNNNYFLQFDFAFMETAGGENKNPEGTNKTDRLLRLLRGARYVIQNGSPEIEILGETITDTGYNPFDRSRAGNKTFIPYVPKTEVIVVYQSGINENDLVEAGKQGAAEFANQIICKE